MNSPTVSDVPHAVMPEASADATIRLEGVTVRYQAPAERLGTFKEYAIRRLQRRVVYTDFDALAGIDLEVHEGES